MNEALKKKVLQYSTSFGSVLLDEARALLSYIEGFSLGYTRCYLTGNRVTIESDTECFSKIMDLQVEDKVLIENLKKTYYKEHYVTFAAGEPQTEIHSLLYNFNLWNCVSLHYHHKEYLEAFHFGTHKNNYEIIKLYVSNPEIFEALIFKLRERVNDLFLKKAPDFTPLDNFQKTIEDPHQNIFLKEENLDETAPKKYYIPNIDTYLTPREADCVALLCKGFSSKQVGHHLNISHRTVEGYIENVKKKLGVQYKNEVISIFSDQLIIPKKIS